MSFRQKRILFPRRGPGPMGISASLFLMLLAVLLLGACTSKTESWSVAESERRNKVDWVKFSHDVGFSDGSDDTISAFEEKRLGQFISEIGLDRFDEITVVVPRSILPEIQDKRFKTVAKFFRDRQIGIAKLFVSSAPTGDLTVLVGRYVVTVPKCPDWRKPAGENPTNRVSANFGCASVSNLGLMVADPGDLVRARKMGIADGDALARGIRVYREGEASPASAAALPIIQSGTGATGQ